MILGDFNIDLLKFGTHEQTNIFVEDMFTLGINPLITRPTRITPHSATLIDHAYTNIQINKISSGIIITDIADHFGIFSIIDKHNRDKPKINYKRSFKTANIQHFKDLLQNCDFSNILNINCPNIAYDTFMNTYKEYYDIAFPPKRFTHTNKHTKYDPWITEGIINSSKTKSKLLNKKLKYPIAFHIDKYKTYCKLFNKIKRAAKLAYYREAFEINRNNIKGTWNIIRSLISSRSDTRTLPTKFTLNNTDITSPQTIADEFNTYFANIGLTIGNNVPKTNSHFSDYINNENRTNHSFFMGPVHPKDIINTARPRKPLFILFILHSPYRTYLTNHSPLAPSLTT